MDSVFLGQATFRAGSLKSDGQGRPICASCGKTAMHMNVWAHPDGGGLVVACSKCRRAVLTVRGPVIAEEVRNGLANL